MSSTNADEAVMRVNMEAADEIARQLRLRDIGGLIVIDFIDMRNAEHKKEVLRAMRQAMKKDRAQHTVLPLSKFGLMQITRQRVRPEVKIDSTEICPTCGGTGTINASILLVSDIERDLTFIQQSHPKAKVKLVVHPYVAAFLKKDGFLRSIQWQWYRKQYRWVNVDSDPDYHLTKYTFFDEHDDEIRLNAV
jgi:ribonuclease G